MSAPKKRGLGRGLEALLGPKAAETPPPEAQPGEALRTLPVQQLQPGKYQPRMQMDASKLTELAESIKAQGVIQPIVVRELSPGKFEIVAGERRWRASQEAGLAEVPVVVRELDDRTVIAMALIENIQREDLSPLEEALALARLIDEFELTHQHAADAVGRSRASVSNLLRLLDLPEGIKRLLDERRLQMGHARALATVQPEARAVALAREAVDNDWSVRQLEEAARRVPLPPAGAAKGGRPARDPNIDALERDLAEKLATRVSVDHSRNGRGKLVIHYHSLDELDGILERIR